MEAAAGHRTFDWSVSIPTRRSVANLEPRPPATKPRHCGFGARDCVVGGHDDRHGATERVAALREISRRERRLHTTPVFGLLLQAARPRSVAPAGINRDNYPSPSAQLK